ncbi:RNA/RNP complex-1-interacting phosphatase-like protein [Lates japonicus]|uniref:RNA/RNP complex-1-interacting phosphatase-like protein n=1 Tax=Lates japonicus TaxID=270547 RepID=A0AAD3MNQ4_LATJO|nr:RNA/RNP complex-1-interacting phosphatase-like protein [Lates japonicus]
MSAEEERVGPVKSLNRQLPALRRVETWELGALNKTIRSWDLAESLLFVKIFTAGHEVPSDDTILSFKRAVRRFLRDNADNDKLIGVHCTHGLNRTGYLICRYLIDVDVMDPKQAVEMFNSSRGYAIERENYLDDLQHGPKRSNEGMEESEQEPQRGSAVHRPRHTSPDSDSRDERRPHFTDSFHHRSFPPRETNHRSHHRPAHDGLLPTPPLLPLPPFRPPLEPRFHPYRWAPPHADSQWRRPPRSEESRSRYPPFEPEWGPAPYLQEDRSGPPPPPHYSPHWTNQSSSCDGAEEEWARPTVRHQHRHRHRVNGYDY